MTAKEYLSQAFKLNKLIKAKESRIQDLRDQAERVSGLITGVKVQSSHAADAMAEVVVKMLDLINEYQHDISRLLDIEREIKAVIDAIVRDDYQLILHERYINLKRWEDIAADNNYSWRTVHYLHSKALKVINLCMVLHTDDVV